VDLDLVFLGTSASMPTAQRAPAALLVRRGGERLLFDCAEGTQRQLQRSTVGLPDIHFDLTDIVIGPQGVCEEADVSATHAAPWLGVPPTGERLEWKVVIWFPWDEERRRFRGEKVYVSGIELPRSYPGSTSV